MNPAITQPAHRTMITKLSAIEARAFLFALSTACSLACAAEDGVPYDLSKETYKTEMLFSYDGCLDYTLMSHSGQPKVHKNNVYVPIVVHGYRPRVLQIPLDGGDARIGRLDPDFYIGDDAHRYFTLGVDKSGYIHLTGGMHTGPWLYWISARPEDVSKFIPAISKDVSNVERKQEAALSRLGKEVSEVAGPPGSDVTYPHFQTDAAGHLFIGARVGVPSFQKGRQGKNVQAFLMSAYDAGSRTFRPLGADIPKEFGGHAGHPVTVFGDNFENGPTGEYVVNTGDFVAGPDNTLHFVFHILNYSSPTGRMSDIDDGARHAQGKDILYALSKDGGRTLQKADGSKVEWPVRAEAGPNQPDVIYAAAADYAAMEKAGDGRYRGLVGGGIQLDWKNRPIIDARKCLTDEEVAFRLENGQWASCPARAFGGWRDNAGVLMKKGENPGEVVRLWDETRSRVVKLGQEIEKLDAEYLRDTGTMIYTTKNRKDGNKVINVWRTTIQRPAGFRSGATIDAAKPGSAATGLDLTYKTTAQGPLRLDLHYPEAPKPGAQYPLVIFTHGGGWAAGDKSVDAGVRQQGVKALAAQGFCVASVDYRLCSKTGDIRIRDCVTDAKDALRFLARNAQRFLLDASRVFTFGDSAGGHIAQMLLLSPPESFPGDPALADASYRLIAGVSWYGPCDFEKTELFKPGDRADVRDRFGPRILQGDADPQARLAAYREVSPVNYLKPSSPPLLMIQGDRDTTIPVHHARYMKERADAVKAPVEILIVQNAGHNWRKEGGALSPSLDEIVAKTAAFMKQQLDRAAPPRTGPLD